MACSVMRMVITFITSITSIKGNVIEVMNVIDVMRVIIVITIQHNIHPLLHQILLLHLTLAV